MSPVSVFDLTTPTSHLASILPGSAAGCERCSLAGAIQNLHTLVLVAHQGLIDLAFDPNFSDNDFFYISHTVNLGTSVSAKSLLTIENAWRGASVVLIQPPLVS